MIKHLNNIINCLKTNPIIFDKHLDDGRLNSAENESEVLNLLLQHFDNIKIPKIREWYDFKIIDLNNNNNDNNNNGNNNEIFVNIKISDLDNNYADNLSSKIGMGYALTGKNDLSMQWEKFHKQIKENIKIGYDYYFLIVNKNNSCDAFWTSLKRIETLIPNGNNLPFQCDWSKNRNFSTRNEIQAIYYILEQYIESWNKKVKGYPFDLKEMLINNNLIC